MERPPASRRIKVAENDWGHMDMTRRCAKCRQKGLAKGNASGLCATCHRQLPLTLKMGALDLDGAMSKHARAVYIHLTNPEAPPGERRETAAGVLKVDLMRLAELLDQPAANEEGNS